MIMKQPKLFTKNLLEKLLKAAESTSRWELAKTNSGDPSLRTADVLHLDGFLSRELYLDTLIYLEIGLQKYRKAVGLDKEPAVLVPEPLQMNRYNAGGFYARHIDGFQGADRRQVSAILYLNEPVDSEATGGETYFEKQKLSLKPEAGTAVYFPSNFCYPHEAVATKGWTKYSVVTWYNIA